MAASYFKVVADGHLQPCCAAGNDLFLGNLRQQSVDEVWNGERAQELRQGLYDGTPPPVCRACPIYKLRDDSAHSVARA